MRWNFLGNYVKKKKQTCQPTLNVIVPPLQVLRRNKFQHVIRLYFSLSASLEGGIVKRKNDFSFNYSLKAVNHWKRLWKRCEERGNPTMASILTVYVNLMNGIGKQWRTKENFEPINGLLHLENGASSTNVPFIIIIIIGIFHSSSNSSNAGKTFVLMVPLPPLNHWKLPSFKLTNNDHSIDFYGKATGRNRASPFAWNNSDWAGRWINKQIQMNGSW